MEGKSPAPSSTNLPPGDEDRVSKKIVLSVAICTHNRSDAAAKLVKRLASQLRGRPVELLLIDSASDEPHRAALAAAANMPEIRSLRVPEKGVSLARNTALAHVRGEWLAFVDDDETPIGNWVDEALSLARRLPGNCGACGGVVRPDVDNETAETLGKRWRNFLGEIAMEGEFDQTERPRFGVGHSLFRIAALRQTDGFNLNLGRDGETLLSGEEVLMLLQLKERGWRIWHSSRITVIHAVEPRRLTRQWVRSRSYWEGVSTARIQCIAPTTCAATPAVVALVKTATLAFLAVLGGSPHDADLRIAFNLGLIAEKLRGLRQVVQYGKDGLERSWSS